MFRSIKSKIIIFVFVVIGLTFGVLRYYTTNRLSNLPPIILLQYQEIVDARAHEFANELDGLENQVEMIALSDVITRMDLDEIQPYLNSLMKQGKFRNFTISDVDGKAWTTNGLYIDISQQQQFKDIIIDKKSKSTSYPFYSTHVLYNGLIITISFPTKQAEKTAGILNGVVTTEFINHNINDITLNNTGYGWIVDDQGQIIAHPQDDITIKDSILTITTLEDLLKHILLANPLIYKK
jgi:methyl-accepting chemotaxis protein